MTSKEITEQLERIAASEDFASGSSQIINAYEASGVGAESIEPFLMFIEEHPHIDYGMPGAIVHFLERFYQKGYENKLIESIRRRPTAQTVLMLSRLINGTEEPNERRFLIQLMKRVRLNRRADSRTVEWVHEFLSNLK